MRDTKPDRNEYLRKVIMSANQIIVGFSFVALLLVGCGRSDSTAKKDDSGNGSAEHPIQKPSHTVAPPSKTSKVTFGNTENDPLQLNGNPFSFLLLILPARCQKDSTFPTRFLTHRVSQKRHFR